MSGRNGNGNKGGGRIITGLGGPEPSNDEQDMNDIPLPPLNNYWIIWFNPEIEKIERVSLAAHTVDVHDDGMLIFKGFIKNENPVLLAAGAPPVFGYYVSSFRNHIRFGQTVVTDGLVH
jgi:hypothetical protein